MNKKRKQKKKEKKKRKGREITKSFKVLFNFNLKFCGLQKDAKKIFVVVNGLHEYVNFQLKQVLVTE